MQPREPDSHGTVVDQDTFALVTELEICKAVRLQYYVSLMAIDLFVADAESTHDLRGVPEQVALVISEQLRGTDLVGVGPTPPQLHVLLVNAHLDSLSLVIQRITDEVSRHVFPVEGQSMGIQLSVGCACFPTTASTRDELVSQAGAVVARDRENRLRRNAADSLPR
jgi:hypothetical protein